MCKKEETVLYQHVGERGSNLNLTYWKGGIGNRSPIAAKAFKYAFIKKVHLIVC